MSFDPKKHSSPLVRVVLVEPLIPENTGNIARTCVGTESELHLVEPMAFEITESRVKRAGLDYWPNLHWSKHASFADWRAEADQTGTSNCDIPESAYPAAAFIEVNKETLAKDFSRGEGESISSLAALLKCQNVPLFTSVVRTQVPTLYDTSRPSLELTRSLLHELKVNPSLATTCSLEGV